MSEAADILGELKAIREDLSYIKEHMVDGDSLMTKEEIRLLEKAGKEHKEGKSIRL